MPDFLTLAQAARVLGLSPATLRVQVNNGKLHATLVGKGYTVRLGEVERYRRDSLGRYGRIPGVKNSRPRQRRGGTKENLMRTIECEAGDGFITEDEVVLAVEIGNETASPGKFHKACEDKIDRQRWTPGPTVPFEQAATLPRRA